MSKEDMLGALSRVVVERHQEYEQYTGIKETEPKYIHAEDVLLSKKQPKKSIHIDIMYGKETFRSRALEWGPLDLDPNKSTVLVKTKKGTWILFWFYKKEVEGLNNLLTQINS